MSQYPQQYGPPQMPPQPPPQYQQPYPQQAAPPPQGAPYYAPGGAGGYQQPPQAPQGYGQPPQGFQPQQGGWGQGQPAVTRPVGFNSRPNYGPRPQVDMARLGAGLAGTPARRPGRNPIRAGHYWFRINKVVAVATRSKGDLVAFEATAIRVFDNSNNFGHQVGEDVNIVWMSRWDSFSGKVVAFFVNCFNMMEGLVTMQHLATICAATNPLHNMVVEVRARVVPMTNGQPFTEVDFIREVKPAELIASLEPQLQERFFPQNALQRLLSADRQIIAAMSPESQAGGYAQGGPVPGPAPQWNQPPPQPQYQQPPQPLQPQYQPQQPTYQQPPQPQPYAPQPPQAPPPNGMAPWPGQQTPPPQQYQQPPQGQQPPPQQYQQPPVGQPVPHAPAGGFGFGSPR